MSKPRASGAAASHHHQRHSTRPIKSEPIKKSEILPPPKFTFDADEATAVENTMDLSSALRKQSTNDVLFALQHRYNLDTEKASLICKLLQLDTAAGFREAALCAVSDNNKQLVQAVLNELKGRNESEDCGCPTSHVFQAHVTPLMLACVNNQYGLVEMLLRRGHHIVLPHRANCGCQRCQSEKESSVQRCAQRIDAYRALSSSAHLWLANHDPVMRAFQLSRELHKTAMEEPNLKLQYKNLEQQVRNFAGRVVQQCWSTDDVAMLLEQKEKSPVTSRMVCCPRLQLALDCRAKEFLADLNVQALLMEKWGKLRWFDWLVHTILFPITSLIYIFSGCRYPPSYNLPRARFCTYLFTYLLFLACLYVIIQYFEKPSERGFAKNPVALLVYGYVWAYIWGMIFWDFCSFTRSGLSRFFSVWWHWFDFVMWCMFMIGFACLLSADAEARSEGLTKLNRSHWWSWDLMLLYEALFATGVVVSFWRIFFFLQESRFIGPTVISIGNCIGSVIHYLVIMVAVILSFAVGIQYLYEPYKQQTVHKPDGQTDTTPPFFISVFESVRSLYWAFYGYLPPYEMRLVTGNAGHIVNDHVFTAKFGEALIAVYHVVIIIVLLNLMISLLVKTADVVMDNEDLEWKFTRCHVWAEFFYLQHAVPPPFNVLHWIILTITDLFSKRRKFGSLAWWYVDPTQDHQSQAAYQKLILTLYHRYLAAKAKAWKGAAVVEAQKEYKDHSSIISSRAQMKEQALNVTTFA